MDLSVIMITLGALFLTGLLADQIGRGSHVPRVTLLLLCGLAVGEAGLGVLPSQAAEWYDFLAITALTMVAFLLGSSLTLDNLRAHGREILAISVVIVVLTVAVVAGGLVLAGMPPGQALLLGAIASATAPAATRDAIQQSGLTGPFPDTLRGIVAIDDAWGLIAFSLAVVGAGALAGQATDGVLSAALWEIGGAVALGLALGLPGAFLTGRLTQGEPQQAEALGLVFLAAGLALWLEVSYLLAGMTAGVVIVNAARHHTRTFHQIEHIQWPFMLLFFILAGASLELDGLAALGLPGAVYVALRIVSRIAGGWIGGVLGGAPRALRPWFGLALLPQAGVAVGMALVAAERFPDWGAQIMALTIATTVIFELIGPVLTVWAVRRAVRNAGPGRDAAG